MFTLAMVDSRVELKVIDATIHLEVDLISDGSACNDHRPLLGYEFRTDTGPSTLRKSSMR